jgi:hypothetical protein
VPPDHHKNRQALLWAGYEPCESNRVRFTFFRTFCCLSLVRVTQKVVAGVYQGVTTVELDVCFVPLWLFSDCISFCIRTLPQRRPHALRQNIPTTLYSRLVSLFLTCIRRPRRTFLRSSRICITMVCRGNEVFDIRSSRTSESQEWSPRWYDLPGYLRGSLRKCRDVGLGNHLQPRFQLQFVCISSHTSRSYID